MKTTKRRYEPTDQDIEKVRYIFFNNHDNSATTIAKELGMKKHRVDNIINIILHNKMDKFRKDDSI